nr:phosphotransferase [Demequina activiva]
MSWTDVSADVVARIEDRVRARVVSVVAAPAGFSPGFAGRATFESGERLFLKAISARRDPWSVDLVRNEATRVRSLPDGVPAPPLQWSMDDGDWAVLAFRAIDGRQPNLADSPVDRSAVFDALLELAAVRPGTGTSLPTFADSAGDMLRSWRSLAELVTPERERVLAGLGSLRAWVERHLDSLVALEEPALEHTAGDRLVHGDLRADNVLVSADRVWLVDWPYACVGAPWFDLAALMPSMAMTGAGPAHTMFRAHPLATSVSPEAERSVVAGIAGYLTVSSAQPELPALPGLRLFQRARALPAVDWLRHITPGLV